MQPSVTFTPTIIHPFPQIDQSLVPVSYCSRRFRKILPKLDANVSNHHNPDIRPSVVKSDNVYNISHNPYIIIIPRVDNTKIPIPNNVRLPRVTKKKPILRITINKMYNTDNNEMSEIHSGLDARRDQSEEEKRPTEQVEIKNYKLNRSVIFTLDSITGEILVTKRPIRNSTCAEEDSHDNKNKTLDDSQDDIASPENREEFGNSCTDPGQQCNSNEKHVLKW